MFSVFSFQRPIGRLYYLVAVLPALLSQYLIAFASLRSQGRAITLDAVFWLTPLRALVAGSPNADLMFGAALACMLAAGWVIAALSFRRATDADLNEWIAAATVAPFIQIGFILFLWVIPSAPPPAAERPISPREAPIRWIAATQGALAGLALVLAVTLGALVFGTYGYGMFVFTPFVIGAAAAWLANRRGDIGFEETLVVVACAFLLGAIALVVCALEGIVCIVLAAPLGLAAALGGGLIGRAIALVGRRRPRDMAPAVAVLPVLFALEAVLSTHASFETTESISVQASPARVWQAIVAMETINEPLALPFRLGVAYPVRGEVIGEGVGAIRRGEFSTGTALERVTAWVPDRKLAFAVEQDVPGLRELSPYEHVHSPHVVGYFRTIDTSFELTARPDGGTDILERTSHELKLEPAPYWLPLARWVVHLNNARVLAHIRGQAERSQRSAATEPAGPLPRPD